MGQDKQHSDQNDARKEAWREATGGREKRAKGKGKRKRKNTGNKKKVKRLEKKPSKTVKITKPKML